MHEGSICRSLLARVLEIRAREQGERVRSVTVELGVLSGFDADHVAEAFAHVAAGTPAEGARLTVETVPLRVHCPACGADSAVTAVSLACPRCQDPDTRLIDGTELRLVNVELVAPTPP